MNILIVDRDQLAAQPLINHLEGRGYTVVHESVRKAALERIAQEKFDVIFIDPAPLPSAREFTVPLRWEQRDDYFYVILMGHQFDESDVIRSGTNGKISKPYDFAQIDAEMANAVRLTELMSDLRLGEGIATDSQIFGQRALYQLVLSALDRSYRYHEQAFLLIINMTNMDEIKAAYGDSVTEELTAGLGKFLSKLHRLSDFLGRHGVAEYVLLILRPAVDSEPHDAIDRFKTALGDFQDQVALQIKPAFRLELLSLPSAEQLEKIDLPG